MKKLLCLILVLVTVLCLCACRAKDPYETMPFIPYTHPPTEPTTEPTEPPVLYRAPLGGRPLDAPFAGAVVSVCISNTQAALPQYGISAADVLCEVEAEDGNTRFLGVFTDPEGAGHIGPVTGTNTFFNSLAISYDAALLHSGGTKRGQKGYTDREGELPEGWVHLDQKKSGSGFTLKTDRQESGYAKADTLFTIGKRAVNALKSQEFQVEKERDYGYAYEKELTLAGEAAKTLTVTFRGGKTTAFTYDEAEAAYTATQYEKPLVDGSTDAPVTFKNLLVLFASQTCVKEGSKQQSYYELTGEGDGFLAIGDSYVKIKWCREKLSDPFAYTLEDGTPVTFAAGNTYAAVLCKETGKAEFLMQN